MTSGIFHIVPLDKITVKRDDRQRKELTDIDILADSIRRLGLIHVAVKGDLNWFAQAQSLTFHRRLRDHLRSDWRMYLQGWSLVEHAFGYSED